jgi:hypothetical protein
MWIAGGAMLLWLIWPWMASGYTKYLPVAALLGLLLAAPPAVVRRRGLHYAVGLVVAALIVLATVRYDGSLHWMWVGLGQGTHQYQHSTHMGPVNNLASIMGLVYRWSLHDPVQFTLAGTEVQVESLQRFLRLIYAAGIVLCAVGLAVQSRRDSPRALLALAAPWVVMFAVLGQMHERYFIWAAAVTAAGAAVGVGPVLLHLLVTALATGMMAHSMLGFDATFAPAWLTTVRGMHPHVGWAIMLLAGIYLYLSLAPARTVRVRSKV